MNYFKIIKDEMVIDVGLTFLKWNAKHKMLFCCDIQEAEYAQSYTENVIYHANWLNPISNNNIQYVNADIIMIDATEYDELKALLNDGEEIIVPEDQQPINPETPQDDEPQEEQSPMTVAEMREKIIEQQEQIEMLTSCVLEMSEIVYA